jgi:hypothetical protein
VRPPHYPGDIRDLNPIPQSNVILSAAKDLIATRSFATLRMTAVFDLELERKATTAKAENQPIISAPSPFTAGTTAGVAPGWDGGELASTRAKPNTGTPRREFLHSNDLGDARATLPFAWSPPLKKEGGGRISRSPQSGITNDCDAVIVARASARNR